MHTNELLIKKFYDSFGRKDYQGMIDCYHPEVTFKDSIFELKGKQAGAMWHMLIESGKDFTMQYRDAEANDKTGKAFWQAFYTFSRTGRKVHNQVHANFVFKDDKIFTHLDYFDFWSWAKMAFGPTGWLLGWTPFFRKKAQASAHENLMKFIAKHPEYQ